MNKSRVYEIMRGEFLDIRTRFGTERKTTIEDSEFEADIEDLIAKEDMIITVTNTGYVKRVPLDVYRAQRRGGKGRNAMTTKEEDFVVDVFVANTHTPMLFFSNTGMAYKMKVYKIPEGTPTSKGKAFINLLPLAQGEVITTVMPLPEDESTWENLHIMFATKKGTVRRNVLSAFTEVRANGKIAMKFEGEDADDALIGVSVCSEDQNIMLATKDGKCINFPVGEIRVFASRASTGVRGIKLAKGDEVISMTVLNGFDVDTAVRVAYLKKSRALRGTLEDEGSDETDTNETITDIEITDEQFKKMQDGEQFILTVANGGFGKKTSCYEYRVSHRGGSGITNIKLNKKSTGVVATFPILDHQQIILVTDAGKLIRIPTDGVRIAGRMTQGVTLFKVADDEKVVSVAVVDVQDEDDGDDNETSNNNNDSEGLSVKDANDNAKSTEVIIEKNITKPVEIEDIIDSIVEVKTPDIEVALKEENNVISKEEIIEKPQENVIEKTAVVKDKKTSDNPKKDSDDLFDLFG
jgi:DNA gyrase subunit A